jgi:hypothetical protein
VKLFFAAPFNFLSLAAVIQFAVAVSRSHFLVKLFKAAPASFFSTARAVQSALVVVLDAPATGLLVCASAKFKRDIKIAHTRNRRLKYFIEPSQRQTSTLVKTKRLFQHQDRFNFSTICQNNKNENCSIPSLEIKKIDPL